MSDIKTIAKRVLRIEYNDANLAMQACKSIQIDTRPIMYKLDGSLVKVDSDGNETPCATNNKHKDQL